MTSCISTEESCDTTSSGDALAGYYSDRTLLWKNVAFIVLLTLGWSACFTFINPLIQLGLKGAGVSNSLLGLISGANGWIYSYLVMYFAWKSDHTVSRFGRRIPYLMISAPIIITCLVLFPIFKNAYILVLIFMVQAIFMDIKAATIPLLNIDCVPKGLLARIGSIGGMVGAILSFLSLRYGMKLAEQYHYGPYFAGALILTATTTAGVYYIKEPPIRQVGAGRFFPWSAMKVAWEDKSAILLMAGVGLIGVCSVICYAWIWLFATEKLEMNRGQLGAIMSWGILVPLLISYPAGHLIDRFRGIRIVALHWTLSILAAWWLITQVHNALTLTIGAMLMGAMGPFYGASDIKVYRDADRRHVGSITSTNSCLRGIINGMAVAISGFLIEWMKGDYRIAFAFGAFLTTIGFLCIVAYTQSKKHCANIQE